MSKRTFIISYRNCMGPVGGGAGVNYKLFEANTQFHIIENCYHVFADKVIEPEETKVEYNKLKSGQKSSKGALKSLLAKSGVCWTAKHSRYRKRIKDYFASLNEKYRFANDDVFVFQDVESAYTFLKMFSFSKTILVYHQQGSLYNEWKSFNAIDAPVYRNYLNKLSDYTYANVGALAFPSEGAKDSLLQSESFFKKTIESRGINILYNGFSKKEKNIKKSDAVAKIEEQLAGFHGFVFSTVSALNEAKAVVRIPQFLATVKRNHSIKWIVVGNGVQEHQLSQEIEEHDLTDSIIWIKRPLPHDDILDIFSLSNFYIMFHRFSIFDYSTIEAMAYGNIPVLTPIGGNKEVVLNDNGIFIEDFTSADVFEAFLSDKSLEDLKKTNKELQNANFSDYSFVERYSVLINKLRKKN